MELEKGRRGKLWQAISNPCGFLFRGSSSSKFPQTKKEKKAREEGQFKSPPLPSSYSNISFYGNYTQEGSEQGRMKNFLFLPSFFLNRDIYRPWRKTKDRSRPKKKGISRQKEMSPSPPSSSFYSPFLFRRGKVPYLSPLSSLSSEPLWQMLLFMLFSLQGKAVVVGSEEPKMEMENPKKTGRVTLSRTRMSLLQGDQKHWFIFSTKGYWTFFEKEEGRKKSALFCTQAIAN